MTQSDISSGNVPDLRMVVYQGQDELGDNQLQFIQIFDQGKWGAQLLGRAAPLP